LKKAHQQYLEYNHQLDITAEFDILY